MITERVPAYQRTSVDSVQCTQYTVSIFSFDTFSHGAVRFIMYFSFNSNCFNFNYFVAGTLECIYAHLIVLCCCWLGSEQHWKIVMYTVNAECWMMIANDHMVIQYIYIFTIHSIRYVCCWFWVNSFSFVRIFKWRFIRRKLWFVLDFRTDFFANFTTSAHTHTHTYYLRLIRVAKMSM